MFLSKVIEENPEIVQACFALHQAGRILPDSYIVDMDSLIENAKKIVKKGEENGIRLYFMLKQIGRNPYIAKKLMEIGFAGAVVVDFKEAQIMMRHHVPIGNIGHLVQVPKAMIKEVVKYKPEVITVYTVEKAKQIGQAACELGVCQPILLRVYDDGDMVYDGQTAGFPIQSLEDVIEKIKCIQGVKIVGATSFPCYLYSEEEEMIMSTNNLKTVMNAAEKMNVMGITPEIINTPSSSCCLTLDMMKKDGSNCTEPGHGLTGTTPAHAKHSLSEKTCVVYVSEISHNFQDKAYCYGGGHYRRSHMQNALVGKSLKESEVVKTIAPELESIDYHFGFSKSQTIGDTVIMAFRYQVFVTRSDVILVKGIHSGKPQVIGVYNSLGMEK